MEYYAIRKMILYTKALKEWRKKMDDKNTWVNLKTMSTK